MLKKLLYVVMILSLAMFFACDDSSTDPKDEVVEFEVVQEASDMVASGSVTPITTAENYFNNSSEYFAVSVRSYDDYQKGHIPGAINIPWRTIADQSNLDLLPMDEKILVYCYTGHTGGVATTVLNLLGYDAYNMKFGFVAWTNDATARATTPYDAATITDYPTETTVNNFTTEYDFPELANTSSDDEHEILLAAANAYVSDPNVAPVKTAQAVFNDHLNDANTIILSVRSADHYANNGHIPGAYNIPWKQIGNTDNLKYLDPSKDIIVYCYTGHTGGIATTLLRTMGYKAYNLKFGMCGWTTDATALAGASYLDHTTVTGYPFNTGINP